MQKSVCFGCMTPLLEVVSDKGLCKLFFTANLYKRFDTTTSQTICRSLQLEGFLISYVIVLAKMACI